MTNLAQAAVQLPPCPFSQPFSQQQMRRLRLLSAWPCDGLSSEIIHGNPKRTEHNLYGLTDDQGDETSKRSSDPHHQLMIVDDCRELGNLYPPTHLSSAMPILPSCARGQMSGDPRGLFVHEFLSRWRFRVERWRLQSGWANGMRVTDR